MRGNELKKHTSKADLVLRNAYVWTVDEANPQAEAVAIKGEWIIAVGSNADIDPLIGHETLAYDLGGKLVLPGFNDSHTHFAMSAAQSTSTFNLYGACSLNDIRDTVRCFSADHPELDWLLGKRWQTDYQDKGWPSRHDLDLAEDSRPVAITDVDFHSAWVNSAALKRLGYDKTTPDPEGGTILREENGYPSGILFEKAHIMIPREMDLPHEIVLEAMSQEIRTFNSLGITSLDSMVSDYTEKGKTLENLAFYDRLDREGHLNLRIYHWPWMFEQYDEALEARELYRGHPKIRSGGLKVLFDGVMSNRTAWLLEEYADAPGEFGYPVMDPQGFTDNVVMADAIGFQVITHALGDRAVREVLNAYERARQINGVHDSRHRIEHTELIHPDDQERYAKLNAIASMTPLHVCSKILDDYVIARVGEPRGLWAFPWQDLVSKGVHLCFGTDWPAIEAPAPDPLPQIFAAVTRVPPMTPQRDPWHPEQALSLTQAIRCYTLEPAYAQFQEDCKGSISVGKVADLCVLSKNIFACEPEEILETEVVMTVFDGKVVFEKE